MDQTNNVYIHKHQFQNHIVHLYMMVYIVLACLYKLAMYLLRSIVIELSWVEIWCWNWFVWHQHDQHQTNIAEYTLQYIIFESNSNNQPHHKQRLRQRGRKDNNTTTATTTTAHKHTTHKHTNSNDYTLHFWQRSPVYIVAHWHCIRFELSVQSPSAWLLESHPHEHGWHIWLPSSTVIDVLVRYDVFDVKCVMQCDVIVIVIVIVIVLNTITQYNAIYHNRIQCNTIQRIRTGLTYLPFIIHYHVAWWDVMCVMRCDVCDEMWCGSIWTDF